METSTIQKKFNQTPQQIQEIVLSAETSDVLYEIEKKHNIYKEENGLRILPKETTKVLIGLTHPKDFVPMLVEKLDISTKKAKEVAKEVNQKIFSQVKDLLIEIHGLQKTKEAFSESSREQKVPPIKPVISSMPKPPQKEIESVIPPVPRSPEQKTETEENVKIPTRPTPPPPPQKAVGGGVTPVPQKNTTPLSQKIKNPFEEKLKQTFTIPKKDAAPTPPVSPNPPSDLPARTNEEGDLQTPIKPQNSVSPEKKAAIKKDPYLETI